MAADPCPIAAVRATVLRTGRDLDDVDGAADTLLVELEDEAGRVGIGEADTVSEAARTVVLDPGPHRWASGLARLLVGADPVQAGALWARLAAATPFSGPSGIARHALAAVDIAVHDLAGRQLGRPAYHLLGGARRDHLSPYATVYAGAVGERGLAELMEVTTQRMARAVELGFRAVKMEVLFEDRASDRDLVACIRDGRRVVGDDVELLVDFGYRWRDWRDAQWVLRRLEGERLFLAEAALPHDDLASHARLAARVETRVGGAELASTWEECRAWLDVGHVDVLQPDVARAGGLTELRRICQSAAERGAQVVPHCWKTGIDAAAARQLQAASAEVPLIETLVPELWSAPLRDGLVAPEPPVVDGRIELPTAPGLGVELQRDVVARYAVG